MLMPMPAKTDKPEDPSTETPHYHGHRMRLRERFRKSGPDALSDYELLEMALFAALPRRDTKPLAKSLLKKFGSFAEVMQAPAARGRGHRRRIGQPDQADGGGRDPHRQGRIARAHPAVVMERRDRLLPHQH